MAKTYRVDCVKCDYCGKRFEQGDKYIRGTKDEIEKNYCEECWNTL